jgi:hypothetical protein
VEPKLAGAKLIVDDDGQQCPTAGYSTIWEALDDAGPGSTITVCAGTYAEALLIDSKPGLKLIGKGSPQIIMSIPVSGAMMLVENSRDVTIQGLVLDGMRNFSPTSTEMTGISFRNSSGTMSNNIIQCIRRANLEPLSFPQGVGIRVYGWNGVTPAAVRILNNTITDIQYAGIWVESGIPATPYSHDGPGMIVPTISRNMIQTLATGGGDDITSGIRLEWVMAGSVSNNVIMADYEWPVGFGIYMHNPARLKITGNTIKAFGYGIVTNTDGGYLVDKNTISNNQIIDAAYGGILFMGGIGGPQLKDYAIQKNKIIVKIPSGTDGIAFTGQEALNMMSGNKVTGNTIQS